MLDFADYAECVTYCAQRESGFGDYEGEWYYGDDDTRTLYHGTFGNDHSPGCDERTWHQTFDTEAEYRAALQKAEAIPEYVEEEEEEEEEEGEDADQLAKWAQLGSGIIGPNW